jgi:succinate dehydrogenase / fumarate reductase cytochrome b subunit
MYRGGPGMLAWALHRITGLAVLLFLFLHIIETFLLTLGPAAYNSTLNIYKQLWFKPLEFLLVAAVIYHALNGIVVLILDAWPAATRYHRSMLWVGAAAYVVLVVPAGFLIMRRLFGL